MVAVHAVTTALAVLVCHAVRSTCDLVPTITPSGVRTVRGSEDDGHYYRDLFIDADTNTLYIGARRYVYKVNLSDENPKAIATQVETVVDANSSVTFNDEIATTSTIWTTGDLSKYGPFIDLLKRLGVPDSTSYTYVTGLDLHAKLGNFLQSRSFQYSGEQYGNNLLDVAEQYSSIAHSGIAAGTSYRSVCEAQVQVLQMFYGSSLPSLFNQNTSTLCARHVRGLTWLDSRRTKLFSLATGIFGTMQLSVTGTSDYTSWLELEATYTAFLNCMETGSSFYSWLSCADRRSSPPVKRPWRANFTGTRVSFTSTPTPQEIAVSSSWSGGFVPPSPENYLGRKRFCDPNPAPRRLVLQAKAGGQNSNLTVASSNPLAATARDTCASFLMASSFLSGHHPDQATLTLTSDSGNGPSGNYRAIYVLTEIGQEKQLDLNLDYLNLPETLPLSSSASLALVRLLVDNVTNDVIPGSVIMTNPFKYTWVTSTLTRWGKMVKSGSQEQVPHRPRAVGGMFETGQYIYFFFREVEWEQMSLPEYSIARHHFQLNSYIRALYYPWEKSYTTAAGRQSPYIKQEEEPGQTREELYAPPLLGWRNAWSQATVTGRVARVCKSDQGMPIGVQDASVYNLDPQLSLWSFQSFVKAKLTCRVPVPATPSTWRFRRDVARSSDSGTCDTVLQRAEELYGKDFHYRAVSRNETLTLVFRPDPLNQAAGVAYGKYYHLSHCRGYKWAYLPKPVVISSAYVEYSELRDVQQVGDLFYGTFSTKLSDEQQLLFRTSGDGGQHEATFGSAVCTFTMSDLNAAFNGPFNRRIGNAWRAYDPRAEGSPVTPSPYTCDSDPVLSKARNVSSMNIDFLDASQPISEELRQFDVRGNSSRLNFFEEDVRGSRTMWNAVGASPVLSRAGVLFDKLVADVVTATYTVLFAATDTGGIYKILTWQQAPQTCWTTSADSMRAWLNSAYMNDVRANPLYPLYNRSADGMSFASDLTMEKYLTFPDDFLYTSDWNCTPASGSRLLSVLKPFGVDGKQKIWSMKLHNGFLVLGTDVSVLQVPIRDQCRQYMHCLTCAVDPYCVWNGSACSPAVKLSQSWTLDPTARCPGCEAIPTQATADEDVILPGHVAATSTAVLKWYFNGSLLPLQIKKYMTTNQMELVIFNFSAEQSGLYELRDIASGLCLVGYRLAAKGCGSDAECRYAQEHAEWKEAFQQFQAQTTQWYSNCASNQYCNKGIS